MSNTTMTPEQKAALMAWSLSVSDEEYERVVSGYYDAEMGISTAPEMVACPVRSKRAARGKPGMAPVMRPKVLDLETGTAIYFKTGGVEYEGCWDNEGQLITYDGLPYTSISGWARTIYGKPVNGWSVCYLRGEDGKRIPLASERLTEPKTRD